MSVEIQSIRIFIAYSSRDLEFKRELKNHLEPLVRNKRIVVMDNYAINPGDNWDEKIGHMLEQSDIVLLLLSADALASEHFFREAEIAIGRRRQGRTDIIPVKLRPCDLEDEPLLQELDLLEVLPEKNVPVVKWPHRDDAYVSIVQGLKRVLRIREEAAIVREQFIQRQREYANLVSQAETLVKKKKWTDAQGLLAKALEMWEEGFEPKRDLPEKHVDKCREKIKEAEDAKRKEEQDAVEAADNAEWQTADEANTGESYKKYLNKYSDGLHAAEAKEKIAAFEEAERKHQIEVADNAAWQAAEEIDTEVACKEYLQQYPDGLHAAEAKEKIAAFEEAERKRHAVAADTAAWQTAEKADTKAAYKDYLQQYPDGLHAAEAKEIIAAFEEIEQKRQADTAAWQASEKAGTETACKEYLQQYPDGLHTAEAKKRIAAFEEAERRREAEAARIKHQEDENRRKEEAERLKKEKQLEALRFFELGMETDDLYQQIEYFSKAIALEPDNADAFYNRASAEIDLKLYIEAIEDFDRVIQINPDDADSYNGRGWAKENIGLLKEARVDYQKALRKDPEHELAKRNLRELDELEEKERLERALLEEQKRRDKENAEKRRKQEEAEKKRREDAERLKREQEQADKSAWELAQKTNTSTAYSKYLKEYPEGRHAVQAYRLQQEALESEAVVQKQREEQARKKREREAIEAREHEEAERLKREQEQSDKSAWDLAQKANNAAAYTRYLEEYPKGRYAVQAYRFQQELLENEAIARKLREEEARKKRERESIEAREREEAERKRHKEEDILAAERLWQLEAERKKREEEARRMREIAEAARRTDPFADLMIFIKGGSFDMGDTFGDGGDWEKPVHRVTVRDFYLCKHPVTQAHWRTIMGSNPSFFNGDNYPVVNVSWDDTQSFIKKLNEQTGKRYRLPTEAEWEYAAREGGKKIRFGNGQNIADPRKINFDATRDFKTAYSIAGERRENITPVTSFQPNKLGLHDMSGNVWEWCQDNWHNNYEGAPIDGSAWGMGTSRVIRGGAYSSFPLELRVTSRRGRKPSSDYDYHHIGFRLAM